jgi:hypothetical protein
LFVGQVRASEKDLREWCAATSEHVADSAEER